MISVHALEPIAREAGKIIMAHYRKPLNVKLKSDNSPVSEADTLAESMIIESLKALAPGVPIISEENPESHKFPCPETFFLVDALDGTKAFLNPCSSDTFTVNIALIHQNKPELGLIYAPATDRMFTGSRKSRAAENGQPVTIQASSRSTPIAVVSKIHSDDKTNAWLEKNNINQITALSSSLKLCLVATGEADVYPRFMPTMEWDTAAGHAILNAAGGQIIEPNGHPLRYGKPDYRNGPFIAYGKAFNRSV